MSDLVSHSAAAQIPKEKAGMARRDVIQPNQFIVIAVALLSMEAEAFCCSTRRRKVSQSVLPKRRVKRPQGRR